MDLRSSKVKGVLFLHSTVASTVAVGKLATTTKVSAITIAIAVYDDLIGTHQSEGNKKRPPPAHVLCFDAPINQLDLPLLPPPSFVTTLLFSQGNMLGCLCGGHALCRAWRRAPRCRCRTPLRHAKRFRDQVLQLWVILCPN